MHEVPEAVLIRHYSVDLKDWSTFSRQTTKHSEGVQCEQEIKGKKKIDLD